MKKYLFTILLLALTAATQGQPNQRLQQLDEFLQQQGINVSHQQTNAIDGSITHIMHAFPNLVNLNATSFPQDMSEENDEITMEVAAYQQPRPQWDVQLLLRAGFQQVHVDNGVWKRIYAEIDEFYNPTPIFTLVAYKAES